MKIRCIANSGFCLETSQGQVLVDPWLLSSDLKSPIVPGLLRGKGAVDVLVPQPLDELHSFSPDFVLFSGLQATQSPLIELFHWVKSRANPLSLGCPSLAQAELEELTSFFRSEFAKIAFFAKSEVGRLELPRLSIAWHRTTLERVVAWEVRDDSATVLFIPECPINRNVGERNLDPLWHEYQRIRPDFVFIGASGRSAMVPIGNGQNRLCESITMSPVEAAQLVEFLSPSFTALTGIHHVNLRKVNSEYSPSASHLEDLFSWSLRRISSKTQDYRLRPGLEFDLSRAGSVGAQMTSSIRRAK